jgi:hypothetical protein
MTNAPEGLPVLSAGNHRSPRSGGCFMEIASYLAGERWSDHPKCSDPSLAELARCVNDRVSDGPRPQLSIMIPSVIGTGPRRTRDRVALGASVVRSCTLIGLRVADVKARPMACALVMAERVLGETTPQAQALLAARPDLAAAAESFTTERAALLRHPRSYLYHAVPQAIQLTVRAVSDELGPQAPPVLAAMLADAIASVRARCGLDELDARATQERWQDACALVGKTPR